MSFSWSSVSVCTHCSKSAIRLTVEKLWLFKGSANFYPSESNHLLSSVNIMSVLFKNHDGLNLRLYLSSCFRFRFCILFECVCLLFDIMFLYLLFCLLVKFSNSSSLKVDLSNRFVLLIPLRMSLKLRFVSFISKLRTLPWNFCSTFVSSCDILVVVNNLVVFLVVLNKCVGVSPFFLHVSNYFNLSVYFASLFDSLQYFFSNTQVSELYLSFICSKKLFILL